MVLSRLFRCRDNAELLQHAQGIKVEPTFDKLSVGEATDDYSCCGRLLSRWGDTHQRALMRACRGPAGHRLVLFSDHACP